MSNLVRATSSSATDRFRGRIKGGAAAMVRNSHAAIEAVTAARSAGSLARPKAPPMVARSTVKPDSIGNVLGGEIGTALTLTGARLADRSRAGKAFSALTGGIVDLSDAAFGLAVVGRLTNVDSVAPVLRRGATRLMRGKMAVYGQGLGDMIHDGIEWWEKKHAAEAAEAAKAETKPAEKPPVQVNASP